MERWQLTKKVFNPLLQDGQNAHLEYQIGSTANTTPVVPQDRARMHKNDSTGDMGKSLIV